jgi:hypothetical protein
MKKQELNHSKKNRENIGDGPKGVPENTPLRPMMIWITLFLLMIPCSVLGDEPDTAMSVYQRLESKRPPTGDAAVIADKDGLYILTIPDKQKIPLDTGPVLFSIYDPYLRVIWYAKPDGAKTESETQSIFVYDLLNEIPSPLQVFEKVSKSALKINIRKGLESSVEECAYSGCIELKYDAKKKDFVARFEGGVYSEIFSEGKKKTKLSVKNKDTLKELLDRNYSPLLPDWVRTSQKRKKFQPRQIGISCSEPDCGNAISFGSTNYFLVMTEYSCNDACHTSYQLYDPNQKKFALPSDPRKVASKPFPEGQGQTRYFFDVTGKYYIFQNLLCNIDTGCEKFEGGLGGFVFSSCHIE